MSVVKLNWSAGKDSTCAAYLHMTLGNFLKMVIYIPMLTQDIPLILKCHYDHIFKTAVWFAERENVLSVDIVSGITYYEYVTHIAKKGKRKGQIFGFPYIGSGMCGFKRDSKLKALNNLDVGFYDYEDIGIAYGETKRYRQLTEVKRSILYELKITEREAFQLCKSQGLLSPIYETTFRDGCSLCPNAKPKEIEQYFNDYPNAIDIVRELQDLSRSVYPDRPPLRGYKWFEFPEIMGIK